MEIGKLARIAIRKLPRVPYLSRVCYALILYAYPETFVHWRAPDRHVSRGANCTAFLTTRAVIYDIMAKMQFVLVSTVQGAVE